MFIWNHAETEEDVMGATWQSNPGFPDATFWLKNLTTVVAAYSFTKLKETNTVCCRLRGATEQDIGFNAENRVDETSALTISPSDGFIVNIQDQTGNGYTATQSNTSKQPAIIEAGVVVRTNGSLPHLRHDLSNDALEVNLPNGQTYYCIASTWSGITHGNFYTAASGPTELPFGVDFFDLLILTNNSEIDTIIPLISDRIADGPYEDYYLRVTFHTTGYRTFYGASEFSFAGVQWTGSIFSNFKLGEMKKNQWLALRIANPENIQNFSMPSEGLKGVFPGLDKLNNVVNIDLAGNNYFTGFFPDMPLTSSSLRRTFAYSSTILIIGDTPNINNSNVYDLRVHSLPRLNGAVILPENCLRLHYFYAYSSALTRLSGSIQNCPDLEIFYINDNEINDDISNLFTGSLPALKIVRGYNNQIFGNVPSLANCSKLQNFLCYNNQITGVASDFIVPDTLSVFKMENNLLTVSAVNQILVAFDVAGRTSGMIDLGGTGNATPDSSSGGFDGLTAKLNLETKGWRVYTN